MPAEGSKLPGFSA